MNVAKHDFKGQTYKVQEDEKNRETENFWIGAIDHFFNDTDLDDTSSHRE